MRYAVDQNISSMQQYAARRRRRHGWSTAATEGPRDRLKGTGGGADQVSDAMATDFTSGLR